MKLITILIALLFVCMLCCEAKAQEMFKLGWPDTAIRADEGNPSIIASTVGYSMSYAKEGYSVFYKMLSTGCVNVTYIYYNTSIGNQAYMQRANWAESNFKWSIYYNAYLRSLAGVGIVCYKQLPNKEYRILQFFKAEID